MKNKITFVVLNNFSKPCYELHNSLIKFSWTYWEQKQNEIIGLA